MVIRFETPRGGDQYVDPDKVTYIRAATTHERETIAGVPTMILIGRKKIPAVLDVDDVENALSGAGVVFARCLSPTGEHQYRVAAAKVIDCDPPYDHESESAGAVLIFTPGMSAPRLPVAETPAELLATWPIEDNTYVFKDEL